MTTIPPLMTSGSLSPLPPTCPAATTSGARADRGANHLSPALTSSYDDVASAVQDAHHSIIARSAVVHSDLAAFDIGAFSIIRGGAVVRPPIRVYVNQPTAGAQACVKVGPFAYVGPQVVCEAAEVGPFVRIEEQCVVAAGARVPEGVWLLPGTFVPPDAALAPYTVYAGVPACTVRKLNARAFQVQHLEFLRELRSLTEHVAPA